MPSSPKKWWQRLFSAYQPEAHARPSRQRPAWRRSTPLQLEALEDRLVPSTWTVEIASASGAGSLAAAVTSANSDTSPALINFDPAVFKSATTITLSTTLTLTNTSQPITIDGSGAGPITVSGGGKIEDFAVNKNVTAVIENLAITAGSATADGGGISNLGTLSVINSTVVGNFAASYGGGIVNGGALTLFDSTLADNSATGGGGIYTSTSAQSILSNCTLSGNSASYAAYSGGGIYLSYGNLTLFNTIVAANLGGNGPDIYQTGVAPNLLTGSNNLIGNGSGITTGIANGTNGNLVGTSANPINALLGSLANNGGPTQTLPLLAGSPAIAAAGAVTQTSAAIASTATISIPVASGSVFAAASLPALATGSYYTIQIGSEQMAVTGVTISGTSATLTVTRATDGTTAGTYASGASVYLVSDQRGYVVPATSPPTLDMGAYQSTAIPATTGPTITAVSSTTPAGTYPAGTTIPITVTFSAPVTVTGTPTLALNTTPGAVATYAGSPGGTLTTLAIFTATNGANPQAALVEDSSGNLFGTTEGGGGGSNDGTVFEVAAGTHTLTTLAAFTGTNGEAPYAGLVEDSSGNLFGTTKLGGASNDGTVFEVAGGTHTLTTLATFTGANGSFPEDSLIEDSSGNLFGTTYDGGASGDGTVFEVAGGTHTLTTLATFSLTNGANPYAGLIEDSSGNLFGTTYLGGASNDGTVFEVAAGTHALTTLASFTGTANGAIPYAGLVEDSSGNLFGTTVLGGTSNDGTVFEVAAGTHTLTTLATFTGTANGASPYGGLIEDSSGDFFGTTQGGGQSNDGTVFEVAAGSHTLTTLATFTGTNGGEPRAVLEEDSSGNLFGTTYAGGSGGSYGTVFEIAAASSATSTLTFNYTVAAGQSSPRLDYTSTSALSLSGGTIQNAGGTNAVLTLPATGSDGLYNQNIVIAAAPTVTAVSPNTGSTTGGTSVTITGTNFTGATAVKFGTTVATGFTVVSATQITAVAPAETAATVNITVTTPSGTSATSAGDQFTFTSAGTGIVVTTNSDATTHAGTSLRDAITTANKDATAGKSDTITFASSLAGQTITLTQGTLNLSGNATSIITVDGGGAPGIAISGGGSVSAFSALNATLNDLTITDCSGSAILGSGTLLVNNCTITDNSAGYGGAISGGTITAINSTFSGNQASGNGAVISNDDPVTLIDCTITGNTGAGNGGALSIYGPLTLIDCTVTGNSNPDGGGAIAYEGGVGAISGCTISQNSASSGGGIDTLGSTLILVDSIVAGNTAATGPDIDGAVATASNDLIGDGSGMTGITNGTNGNLVGTAAKPLQPLLNTLSNNGGTTQTMSEQATSPALNAGGSLSKAGAALTTASSTVTVANGLAFAANNLPALAQLAFTSEPNNVAAGSPLNPISVQELDSGAYYYIQIDGEEMAVTSVTINSGGTATLSVLRGVNGTTIAPHAVNAPIDLVSDQRGEVTSFNNPAIVDIGAYQSTASSPAPLNSNPVVGDTITMSLSAGALTGTTTATTDATGVATFSNLSVANAGTYTLTAASGTEATSSNSFVVTAGALTFTAQPSNAIVGASLGIITITDFKVGNPVPGAIVTMTISSGTLSGTTTATTDATGTATFTNLFVNVAGTYTLSANAAGAATAVSSSFTISALTLAFSTSPANTSAGTPFTVALDYASAGTPVAGAVITISISSGTLNGPSTATTSALGIATFSGLSITTPGTYTLSATSPGPSAKSNAFTISVGAVAALSFTTQPGSTTAGSTMNAVTVQAADAYGNLIAGQTVNLSVSSGTLNGTLTATTNASGLATFAGLSDNTAGTYTLTATSGTATGLSSAFTIGTAGLASLAFTTGPVSITAGNAVGPVVVKAADPFGNVLPGTVVSLAISSGTLTGTLMATASASGLATFAGLSDTTAGTYTLTATSGTVTTLSSQFIIAPAAASKLTFTTEPPATITANSAFAAAVQVTDSYGNLVPNASVTLTPSSGTLTGTKTVLTDATGTATFGGLAMSTVGTAYTLTATASTLTAQSTSFNVTPGALAALAFTIQPASTTAGSTLGSVTVKATDTFGNAITNALIAVTISGTLNGTTALATGTSGLALFSNLSINQAGAYTITATSGTATAVSQSFVISPAAAATLAWTIAPVSTTAGLTFTTVAVNVVDKFNNPVPNVAVSVISEVFKTSEICTLNGTTSVNTGTNGTASFVTLSMTKAGTYTLTASATSVTSIVSGSFTISPAASSQLLFTTEPKSAAAGTALNVAVEALDSFGNTVPGVTISSLTLSPAATLNNFAATATTTTGLAAFNGLSVNTMGSYTMTASGAGLNVTSTSFVISPAAVATISFVNQPGTTNAGNIIGPVTAQAVDAYGNPVPNVAIGMALGGGSFSTGTTTIVTNSAGQAVFGNLITKTVGSYTLAMSATGVSSASSNSFNVIVAAPMLSFSTQPVNANNGATMRTVVVRATDKYGNVVSGMVVNLTLSSGTLTGPATAITDATGQASFSNLSIMPPGTGYTLTASATGLPSVRSNAFNIVALRGTSLTFTSQPSDTTAGSNLGPVTLAVLDTNSNPVSGIPITISISAAGRLVGALSAVTDTSGNAVFSNLSEDLVGTFTLKATSQGMSTASDSFTITAGSAAKVTFVTQPTGAVAGNALKAVSVLTTDRFGNIAAGATVSIGLLSGSLSSGTLSVESDATGKAGFIDLTEDTAGTYTLVATAGSATAFSRPFVIKPAAASQFLFLSQPGNGKAGAMLSSFTVEALDSFGNVATTSPTAIRISDGRLSKGPYCTNALGRAVIANWTETMAGTDTLTATATGGISATSNSFSIAPAAGTLSFLSQPSKTAAGSDIGPVTVRIADRYGNGLSGVTVAIGITPGAPAGGAQTLSTDATGEVVFDPLTENLAGTYTLVATAPGLGSLRSRSFTVAAGTPATLSFLTQPQTAHAGSSLGSVTAEFLDQYGNVVTTAGTQVTMGISSGTLKGTATAATNTLGRAVFNTLTETTAGTYTLQATGAGLSATSNTFVVSANTASRLTFLVQPAAANVGGNLGLVTVQVDDSFGNPLVGQTVTITGSTTLIGVKSAVTDASGDATFSSLSGSKSGTFTLTAYDSGRMATSSPFTITA